MEEVVEVDVWVGGGPQNSITDKTLIKMCLIFET